MPDVATPCYHYRVSAKRWDMPETMYAGAYALLDRAAEFLPKFAAEEAQTYEARKRHALLDNVYARAIDRIVATPFSRDVQIRGDGSTQRDQEATGVLGGTRLADLWWDVDGTGTPFTGWLADVFRCANRFGVAHVLADYPAIPGGSTLADEIAAGGRPYLHLIQPDRLIGWSWGSDGQLDTIRIREWAIELAGRWGEVSRERVRVIGRDWWQLWQRVESPVGDQPAWQVIEEGDHTLGNVPLLTYRIRTLDSDRMAGLPPHETLAQVNLAHWQSTSDQRNILHHSRVPIIVLTGVEPDQAVPLKPGGTLQLQDPKATASWLEHSGKAIEAGAAELMRMEDRMRMLSLQPFQPREGMDVKATAVVADNASSKAEIQRWIRDLEAFAVRCLERAASITGDTLPESLSIDVFSDFTVSLHDSSDLQWLDKARARGDIDAVTFLTELRRRGVLDEMALPAEIWNQAQSDGLNAPVLPQPPDEDE